MYRVCSGCRGYRGMEVQWVGAKMVQTQKMRFRKEENGEGGLGGSTSPRGIQATCECDYMYHSCCAQTVVRNYLLDKTDVAGTLLLETADKVGANSRLRRTTLEFHHVSAIPVCMCTAHVLLY